MKKSFLYFVALVLSLSIIISCSSNDDDSPKNTIDIQQLESTAETGTWRVTNLVDSDEDETSDFNGYDFTFSANGTVTATNGTTTYNGTWSITSDDSDVEFNLFFPVPDTDNFEDLNDDWDIVSYSDTIINLIDVSGGNADTDVLTFERN
ncbi:MAG: hypothetical protein P8K68_11235 [Algibacter sp.]|uniref:hypothetical protein n=1 Tax=Algibacter sp. TaxID=1872428 RepID=UPI002639551C|nr:hypothetical protein [Algibacter sp.]MDG1730837.1 hypothetical protein [Algibacter sp.]MDG2179339.1 hypothetical protein [Algibacter sp.]